ncbi:hypothetical protein DWW78_10065 [Alistipes indistinctus]|jgi:hypothetical protein|uniref:three component ABC system middle component n=1 Tax=Alistipes indistinctus TaxID=626932 RepID=UPI000E54D1A7|nr:three component ABC system middle component [Alistipes indistinctus]RGU35944.1 hypothetical protein DWW78_10065 [Alistipes indistinctus]
MKQIDLFDILQNPALGALAIWGFVQGYQEKIQEQKLIGKSPIPLLEYVFFVLPVVYNQEMRQLVKRSYKFSTLIEKNENIILDLQERAEKMRLQTLECLNLAFSKKILALDIPNHAIKLFTTNGIPRNWRGQYIDEIIISATRLGKFFAQNTEKTIQTTLNIRIR